ncbi:ComF family protein [Patescibacteria group bacterium]|nr:ComF family protein [Patescibacteria group bacterium]
MKVEFLEHQPQLPPNCALDSITICFAYAHPISELIHDMKYQSVLGICELLGELLYFHTKYPDATVVTSVPLHKESQRLRGFNQAKEVALAFSHWSKIPYQELLRKQKQTTARQATLKEKAARFENMLSDVFTLHSRDKLPDPVLIIDDVYTTGATLQACARVLKKHGVRHVYGLAVAHQS